MTLHLACPMTTDEPPLFNAVPIDARTVAISGDVDSWTAPDLATALADPAVDRVVLTAVAFMNAAGVAVLLDAHRARPHGLTLCSPSRCVLRLLDLVGHRATFRISTG